MYSLKKTGLIYDILNLDIYDCNYVFSSKKLNFLSRPKSVLPRQGILFRLIIFFFRMIKNFTNITSYNLSKLPKNQILFFSSSRNQEETLVKVKNNIKKSYFINIEKFQSDDIPMFIAFAFSILFIPIVLMKYFVSGGYIKKSFSTAFDFYLITYGFYALFYFIIWYLKPKAIFLANDHSVLNRIIIKIARTMNVPTYYIQHAFTTSAFPALDFDYALLSGKDSFEKYEIAGNSKTVIHLVGMVKLGNYHNKINYCNKVRSIGIAIKKQDDFKEIQLLSEYISREFPSIRIIIRPHPSIKKTLLPKIMITTNILISNSKRESVIDFLSKIDVVIASESSILAEAAVLNIFPIYYTFGNKPIDYYGFVKNGLICQSFTDPNNVLIKLKQIISEKHNIRKKAKDYSNDINSKWDGHPLDHAMNIISSTIII